MPRGGNDTTVALSEFIRREKDEILRSWETRARSKVASTEQSRATLIDSLPLLLDRIAANADALMVGAPTEPPRSVVTKHATERMEQGYSLGDVVEEYLLLRATIFERLEELELVIEPFEARQLHRAIDEALGETARRYVATHERMLRAVDRIAGATSANRPLDEVLGEIIRAMKDASGADVDSVAILLLGEDGRLHARASIGLEAEVESGFSVAPGEGFAGTIALTKAPLFLPNAATHPVVVSEAMRKRGTMALYGVPLLDEGNVLGVAHVGSRQAHVLSEDDLLLFRTMSARAAAIIVRAQFVDALQRTAEFREQFIGVLGHDLRSPLNTIVMSAELVLMNETSAETRNALQRIVRTAARMDRLIGETLDFTRMRFGGGLVLARSRVDLSALVRSVVDEMSARAGDRAIVVDAPRPVEGNWDRDRLAQTVVNLVDNALQHGETSRDIEISVSGEAGTAICEVTNHGAPIPSEKRSTLFEPFTKSSTSSGLGLGLFIACEVARAHGGSIKVMSRETTTTFAIRLPVTA